MTSQQHGARAAQQAGPEGDLGSLAVDLRLACMRISRRIRFESGPDQLPPHRLSVLARLDAQPSTPGELATAERVSAPSMTRTVAALVADGLVARTASRSDRRQVVLALTDHGRATLAQVRARRDLWMASRLEDFDADELAALRAALPLLAQVAAR